MSRLRPLLLLSLALLAMLPLQLQASATAGFAGSCGPAGCCCGDQTSDIDGPSLSPASRCPCATPSPLPTRAPRPHASSADPASSLPLSLADTRPCGVLAFAPAARRLVREPPTPPPVRDVLGVRLL